MDIQKKISQLNHFLRLSLASTDAARAEKNLEVAEKLLQQVQFATLNNPWGGEETLSFVVQVGRNPLWNQAKSRAQDLRRASFGALAA